MVRWLFLMLLILHGLIHLMGFAKAFGLAKLPQLTQPIPRSMGVLWLVAALAFIATAAMLVWAPRLWWAVALLAVALSQIAIAASWGDAKFGTLANVIVLLGVAYGFASQGPISFRAEYRQQVVKRLNAPRSPAMLTEADVIGLPLPVQRYIRQSGAIGQPRVHHVRATWRGRIRGGADEPWMPFTAEQHNFVDEPARFFLMDATRGGLPVDVYHTFTADDATMRVRLLSIAPLVRAGDATLRQAETVTILNDMAILAPATLIDPAIRWEPMDARSARAHYGVGEHTISAVLHFNDADELVDFVSDDRLAASADGKTFAPRRWSTPLRDYRSFGARRAATHGTGRWHAADGSFDYIELELLDLSTNAA